MKDVSRTTLHLVGLLFAGVVAGYPLVAVIALIQSIDNRTLSTLFRAALMGVAIIVTFLLWRNRRQYRGAVWLLVMTFWCLYTFRIALDGLFVPRQLGMSAAMHVVWGAGTCFIPMLAFLGNFGFPALRLAARYTFLAALLACALSLYATYVQLSYGVSSAYATGRLGLDTINPITLGHLGVTLALLAFTFFSFQGWAGRIGLAVTMLMGLFLAGAAGSRGPILTVAVCVLLVLVVSARRQPAHRIAYAVGLTILASGALFFGALLLEERLGFRIVSRIQSSNVAADESSRYHFGSFVEAQEQFLANPLIGSSLEVASTRDYPHNVAVESFMATGMVGGTMFCIFLFCAAKAAFELAKEASTRWLGFLCVQAIIAALTSGAIVQAGSMWCLCAAAIAVHASRRTAPALSTITDPYQPGLPMHLAR